MKRLLLPIAALLAGHAVAAQTDNWIALHEAQPAYMTNVIASRQASVPLLDLIPGSRPGTATVRLTGTDPEQYFALPVRRDEIVSKASLQLKFTPSPSLLPDQSHLNVYLNGQLQSSIPVNKDLLGKTQTAQVELDARLLKDSNMVSLELIGHYALVCEQPTYSSLWMTVDSASTLTTSTQKVRLGNDLSFFPVPFIDTLSNAPTVLPFVFAQAPGSSEKTAAAILASWCGSVSAWRGTKFPVYYAETPAEGHFVAFITNERRPEFLKDWPKAQGPEIAVANAPASQYAKMLVISGRNDADLISAVRTLTAAQGLMSGSSVRVTRDTVLAPRKPYDAPRWVDTSRPVRFGDLTEYSGQLTSTGVMPQPVSIRMTLPPDLFASVNTAVNLRLKYSGSKPEPAPRSFYEVLVNNTVIASDDLTVDNDSGTVRQILNFGGLLPGLWDNAPFPARLLRYNNTISVQPHYAYTFLSGSVNGACSGSSRIAPKTINVSPDSTIDFTNFYHYAKLPDVRLFNESGFPFTRMADLSETVVLIGEKAEPDRVSLFLTTMGRLGAQTGTSVTNVTVLADASNRSALENRDILSFLPQDKPAELTALVNSASREVHLKAGQTEADKAAKDVRLPVVDAQLKTDGALAAITGTESPFTPGRSMVSIMSSGTRGTHQLTEELAMPASLSQDTGGVMLLRDTGPTFLPAAKSYWVGELPLLNKLWFMIADHPMLLVLAALLSTLFAGSCIYLLVSQFARRRLRGS